MSVPSTVLSVISDAVTKFLVDQVPNRGFSIDAALKIQNIEIFKNADGIVETRFRKIKKAKDVVKAEASAVLAVEDALLAPVDAESAPVSAPVSVTGIAGDPYSTHPSRLASIDPTRCMGRRIKDEPLAGTRKGDPGANGQFFPETQCTKKPKEGKLCTVCIKLEALAKAEPKKKVARWYGRLDEPLYWNAFVIGCENFCAKYPNGLPSTTEPVKVVQVEKSEQESVAVEAPVKECVWVKLVLNGMNLVRNLKNGNVYQANTNQATPDEMVLRENFEGRWVDGDLDPYAAEIDD